MKTIELQMRNNWNHETQIISHENPQNHENQWISNENYKILKIMQLQFGITTKKWKS